MIITRGHETTNFRFLLKKHNECFHFKEFRLRKICVYYKSFFAFVFLAEAWGYSLLVFGGKVVIAVIV